MTEHATNSPRFGELKSELQKIIQKLQSGEIEIEDLVKTVGEGYDLLQTLDRRLLETELQLKKVIAHGEKALEESDPNQSSEEMSTTPQE